jgi:hypothetical protein
MSCRTVIAVAAVWVCCSGPGLPARAAPPAGPGTSARPADDSADGKSPSGNSFGNKSPGGKTLSSRGRPAASDDKPKTPRELLDDLFRTPPPRYVITPTPDQPISGSRPRGRDRLREGAAPSDEPTETVPFPDGYMLVERAVVVRRVDRLVTVLVDGKKMTVLPSRALTDMESVLEVYPQAYYLMTGQATTYRGVGFVLPRRVKRLEPGMIADALDADVRDLLASAEMRMGLSGCDRPLGRWGPDPADRRPSNVKGPRPKPDDEPKEPDVAGHLSPGASADPDKFFEADPTRARLRRAVPEIPVGPLVPDRPIPPRVPQAAEIIGRGLAEGVGRDGLGVGGARDEGAVVISRTGRIVGKPGGYLFYFDSGEPPILVLPNGILERADSYTGFNRRRVRLRVSGELTLYQGRNHLLLTKVVGEYYDASEVR